ncbi:twin-arginine translocase subunit TatC [Desulfobacter latus]|uniref:Sec-independent protein translocase protein TatC n=1 Tax=Desulfobacter latus TaxID=2292 RepID=A0A850T3Q2_9BACT|nr:twin-arginine translocase subunit TatC [Desulfobacter latus]NWH06383.1 twin-arginine translocase subunit TatC [Desulfobacter latus]
MSDQEEKSPFTEHLGELRDRLIHAFIAVGVGFIAAYFFKEQLFDILTAPLVTAMEKSGNAKLIFTGLPEAFFTYLKVALLAGIILATPVLFYEFWMFVSPGLYRQEKKYILPIIILSLIFFIAGASFGYFIVFPYGFQFFLGFTTETIQAMPSMKEYLSFASKMLLAFGFVFELPLVLTFLSRMGLVTPAFLKKNRKYALLVFFVGAAMITPPDVVTQVMMAMPLILLYEIGILGAKIFGKASTPDSEEKEEKEEEDDDDDDDDDEQQQKDDISAFDNDPETDDTDSELEN